MHKIVIESDACQTQKLNKFWLRFLAEDNKTKKRNDRDPIHQLERSGLVHVRQNFVLRPHDIHAQQHEIYPESLLDVGQNIRLKLLYNFN